MTLPAVVPDDREGLQLADPPGMVFPAVVQPEISQFFPDRDAAPDGFARAGDGLAGAIHDGNVAGFLENDPGGIAKRDNLLVFFGIQVDVFIQHEYLFRIPGRKHLAVVAIEDHPADDAKGLKPGQVPCEVHQAHGRTHVGLVKNKVEVVVEKPVDSPTVDLRQSSRGLSHDCLLVPVSRKSNGGSGQIPI